MSTATALVIGTTGKQGSATVNAFLNRGFHIRALTRNVRSPAAGRERIGPTGVRTRDSLNLVRVRYLYVTRPVVGGIIKSNTCRNLSLTAGLRRAGKR